MDTHALTLLRNEALWKKMGLTKSEANHPGLVTSLLFHLISESQALGGSFLDEFWLNLGKCHPRLPERSTSLLFIHSCLLTPLHLVGELNAAPELISENDVSVVLFNGISAINFNIEPIFSLAGEFFTHLGLTCTFIHFIPGSVAY